MNWKSSRTAMVAARVAWIKGQDLYDSCCGSRVRALPLNVGVGQFSLLTPCDRCISRARAHEGISSHRCLRDGRYCHPERLQIEYTQPRFQGLPSLVARSSALSESAVD
jgi:hypothetical protein